MTITLEIYDQIRQMYSVQGLSQREIARTLGISRNTVSKYCRGDQLPSDRKPYTKRSGTVVTPEIINFIKQCFEEDKLVKSKKQHHTAVRIHERLVDELDFEGSESTIRRIVRELKEKTNAAFIPLSFEPGEAAQVDYGEADIILDGEVVTVKLFCARLCHSNAFHVTAFPRENLESFLEGHIRAFEHFGGVPNRAIFDNAKVAVSEGYGAYVTKQTERYLTLQAHYAFYTDYCNVNSGHEKGLVENLVGYVRRNALVPRPKVQTLEELNQHLERFCIKYLNHTIQGQPTSVGEMFALEKDELTELPRFPLDVSNRFIARVNSYSLVSFETNKYSVPCKYSGYEVTVRASSSLIEIWYRSERIAHHNRCYLKHQKIYELSHYMPLIEKRPRSVLQAAPIKQNLPVEVLQEIEGRVASPHQRVEAVKAYLDENNISSVTPISSDLGSYDRLIKGGQNA